MLALQFIPVVLSLLALGAHFYRAGESFMVGLTLGLLVLTFIPRLWAGRVVQLGLLLGGAEWVRTLVVLATDRLQAGRPVTRLGVILASVALVAWLSAFLVRTGALRRWYRLGQSKTVQS